VYEDVRRRLAAHKRRRVHERLMALRDRPINYDPDGPHDPAHGWRIDDYCELLPPEPPGEPVDGGPFQVAQKLLRDYKVADPAMVVAHYDHNAELEGRNMLLELKFMGLHSFAGCRVGRVKDEEREVDGRPVRVWGWPYQTLEGHIEQGEMHWEVWTWMDTGDVQFRIHSYSRGTKSGNPVMRLGFRLVGQWQRRLYLTHACQRMAALAAANERPQ
jgi:uncharacterized protein (UPF0548 family)